ncbi:MAG: cell division protein SepF [Actinomycetota bacterium]|jgi:cell division inhibitor SepF|nr:cell division protein SepF [Actinomycetota bacterium]
MPTFLKKTMVYLGLLDDEYDEYDEYEDRSQRSFAPVSRPEPRFQPEPEPGDDERTGSVAVGRIRTLQRDSASHGPATGVVATRSPVIRPMSAGEATRVQVVAPTRFGDAKEIADCLKANRPVIVNLQVAERDLQRRMIDFCSGVTYALSGEMEKVADEVFLLAPTNVKVSEEERQRLQERGYGRS